MMSQVFTDIMGYIHTQDFDGLKQYLNHELGYTENMDTIKCDDCGDIRGRVKHTDLIRVAFSGGDTLTEYLILKHLQLNPGHRIYVNAPGVRIPIGDLFLRCLTKSCESHDLSIDEGFEKRLPYLEEKLKR